MDNRITLSGIVTYIGEPKIFSEYFTKREFKIRFSDIDITNKAAERIIKFDVINKNVKLLDDVKVEDLINVSFYIEGRDLEKDGKVMNFTTLVCYNLEIVSSPSRDTIEDYKAVITENGKEYKPVIKPATDEELAGYMVEPDPLIKVPGSEDKERLKDVFENIESNKNEINDLPF